MKVQFFTLDDAATVRERLQMACQCCAMVVEKSVFIICADEFMAQQLDEMLWMYKPEAFLPHVRLGNSATDEEIVIGVEPERIDKADIVIYLGNALTPDIPKDCQQIIEIVSQDAITLHCTRTRYRYYKKQRHWTPNIVQSSAITL